MDDRFALLRKLRDGELDEQLKAIRGLQKMPDPRVVDALIEALQDESKDPFVREDSAEALGKIGNPKAILPLIEAFREMDAENSDLWWKASQALLKIKDSAVVDALCEALQHDIPQVRMGAAYTLGEIGDTRAVEPLIAVLREDQEERVRAQAAHALGQLRDKRAVESLVEALQDQGYSVRYAAIVALWKLGAGKAVPFIRRALHDEHPSVREIAAWVLGTMHDHGAVEVLLGCLEDKNPEVRAGSATALGQIRASQAVEALIARLSDENEGVKRAVIWALVAIGDERAVEPLREIRDTGTYSLKMAAARALGEITSRSRQKSRSEKKNLPTPKGWGERTATR